MRTVSAGLFQQLPSSVATNPGSEPCEEEPERSPSMGLAEAVDEVIEILRNRPASSSAGLDTWERIVGIIAEHGTLPQTEVDQIEKTIAEVYRGWSDAQRRSIWYETETGMTDDDDDDSLCDTSFNGIGYALQIEVLDEVTKTAWADARELKSAAKKPSRGKKAIE